MKKELKSQRRDKVVDSDRDTKWVINQYNRNRELKDRVFTKQELKKAIKKNQKSKVVLSERGIAWTFIIIISLMLWYGIVEGIKALR